MLQFVSFVFSMSFVTVSAHHSMEQQTPMFLSLSFAAPVPTEAFLVTSLFLSHFISQMSFGFPNTSPIHWSNVSVFLLGSPPVLPLSIHVLFVLELSWESLTHPCCFPATLAWFSAHWNGLFLRRASPWRSTSCPEPHTNWILPGRFPSRPKPAFLKSRVMILLFALLISLKIFNSTVLFAAVTSLTSLLLFVAGPARRLRCHLSSILSFFLSSSSGSPRTSCLLLVVISAISFSR